MTKHTKSCPECEGRGEVTYERIRRAGFSRDSGFIEEYTDDCDNCGGTGEVDDDDYSEEDE
jgi:DnaJ-class molecular chaperone